MQYAMHPAPPTVSMTRCGLLDQGNQETRPNRPQAKAGERAERVADNLRGEGGGGGGGEQPTVGVPHICGEYRVAVRCVCLESGRGASVRCDGSHSMPPEGGKPIDTVVLVPTEAGSQL